MCLIKQSFGEVYCLETIKGLLELGASLPSYVLQLQIDPTKRGFSTKDGYLKREYREEKQLEDINNLYDLTLVLYDNFKDFCFIFALFFQRKNS